MSETSERPISTAIFANEKMLKLAQLELLKLIEVLPDPQDYCIGIYMPNKDDLKAQQN